MCSAKTLLPALCRRSVPGQLLMFAVVAAGNRSAFHIRPLVALIRRVPPAATTKPRDVPNFHRGLPTRQRYSVEVKQNRNMTGEQPLSPAQRWRLHEFRRRLEYVGASYQFWKDAEKDQPTFNESLRLLRRAWECPNRKRRDQIRLHPMIEIGVSIIAFQSRSEAAGEFNPTQAEIEAACRELLRRTKALRGRPQDLVLRYHVKGLILACEWASGTPVTASPTTNSEYDPQMTSDGAKSIEIAFKRIDPSVTKTT